MKYNDKLEKDCAVRGTGRGVRRRKPERSISMPKHSERICIIGGGPAGISAAMYLEKKGYVNPPTHSF